MSKRKKYRLVGYNSGIYLVSEISLEGNRVAADANNRVTASGDNRIHAGL